MKKIALKSGDWYSPESYPEFGFYTVSEDYEKGANAILEDNVVLVLPNIVLAISPKSDTKMMKALENMGGKAGESKEFRSCQKKLHELETEIGSTQKALDSCADRKAILTIQIKNKDLTINEWKKKYDKLKDSSQDMPRGVSEEFMLKTLSIAIGNDKYKDL